MIEQTVVEGKKAFVSYLDDEFNPASKTDATMVKVLFESGDVIIAHRAEALTSSDDVDWDADELFADYRPTEDEAKFDESKHPRDKGGKFATSPGGGESKGSKKGTKKSVVGELLTKGTSMAEITAATGWKNLSMPAMAKALGVGLQKYKENGVTKYKSHSIMQPEESKGPKQSAEWDDSDKSFAEAPMSQEMIKFLVAAGLEPKQKVTFAQIYKGPNAHIRVNKNGNWYYLDKPGEGWTEGGHGIESLTEYFAKKDKAKKDKSDKTPLSELTAGQHANAVETIQQDLGIQLDKVETVEDIATFKKQLPDFADTLKWYNVSDEDALALVKEAQQQESGAAVTSKLTPEQQKISDQISDIVTQMNDGLLTHEEGVAKINELKAQVESQVSETPKALKLSDLTKTGNAKGSNPGGIYIDEDGKKYYVKLTDEAHAQNEILAGKLYELTGAGTKKYIPLEDGKGIASEWIKLDKDNAKNFTAEERKQAQLDFATHAWLANWDAAGLNFDNQVIANGKPMTVDVGGALEYRAQGAAKGAAFGDSVEEWDNLRDPSVNKENAEIFGSMTPEQLKESVDRVSKVTDDQIWNTVNAMTGKDNSAKIALAAKLQKRRNDLVNRANKEFEAKGSKLAVPPPLPPPKAPRPPKQENPIGHLNFVKAGEPDAKGNQIYEKGDNKVKMTPTEEWISVSPGHGTKQGKGKEDLKNLLEKGTIGPSVKSAKGATIASWNGIAIPAVPVAPAAPVESEQFTPQSTKSSQAAQIKMKQLVSAAPKPTPSQKSAVASYTSSDYQHINSSLREGGLLEGDALHVQEYLTQSEIPEDLIVYRKVGGQYASFLKSIIFEGGAFQDKGFSSTALTPDVWHGAVHFQIKVKKGSKGAAVQHLSAHKHEMEILLPAGAKYKVTKIAGHQVELEYMGI